MKRRVICLILAVIMVACLLPTAAFASTNGKTADDAINWVRSLNGQPVGTLVDGYSEKVEPTGPVSFGQVQLKKGVNQMVIELIGKESRADGYSNGYLVGIDGFMLNKE